MENCELTSYEMYNKLIKIFPEFEEWMEKDIEEIKKFLKKELLVLDIGCGWGREIKELAPFCKKIIGIDNDYEEIENAKSYLKGIPNIELYVEDAKKTSFQNNYFDIIIIVGNTFGNLGEDKEKVLREMKRILKQNGKILLSVYVKGSKKKRLKAYQSIGTNAKGTKKGRIIFNEGLISEEFSKKELKSIFDKEKLKVKFVKLTPFTIMCLIGK